MKINYSDQEVIKGEKSIFLAGPTPRNKDIVSWRVEACEKLEAFGFDGVVYVPESSDLKPRDNYNYQTMWEREALSEASVIAFWIPREIKNMPAFTTNVEFGYWIHTGKVLYGRPDGAPKTEYLDWLYQTDYNKLPIDNLDELLFKSIELSYELYDGVSRRLLPLRKRITMEDVD